MSYHVYFTIGTGAGNEVEVDSRDYTVNVAPMWAKALGGSLGDLIVNQSAAESLEPFIRAGITDMAAKPAMYQVMNPENQWGDYDGALGFLRWVAGTCAAHPKCTVRVLR